MTLQEIFDAGRARALDFGDGFPTTAPTAWRRIQIREQMVFSAVARTNPDYFGVNVIGLPNSDFDVDLKSLDVSGSSIDATSLVTRVEILDPGTSAYVARQTVNVITPNDPDAALAPRVWIRNFVVHGYKSGGEANDLQNVTSICIFYGFRPAPRLNPLNGTEDSALPTVWQEVLVTDIATWLLKQTLSMSVEAKAAAIGILKAEDDEMMAVFLAEAADYAGAQVSRYGSVVGSQRT